MITDPCVQFRTSALADDVARRAFERTGRRPKVQAVEHVGGGLRWIVADPEGVAA